MFPLLPVLPLIKRERSFVIWMKPLGILAGSLSAASCLAEASGLNLDYLPHYFEGAAIIVLLWLVVHVVTKVLPANQKLHLENLKEERANFQLALDKTLKVFQKEVVDVREYYHTKQNEAQKLLSEANLRLIEALQRSSPGQVPVAHGGKQT